MIEFINNLFHGPLPLPAESIGRELVFSGYDPAKTEQREIERLFARFFISEDGRKVLAYLQMMTFQRAASPSSAESEIRHMEGQRALMATILRLIDRGRSA